MSALTQTHHAEIEANPRIPGHVRDPKMVALGGARSIFLPMLGSPDRVLLQSRVISIERIRLFVFIAILRGKFTAMSEVI